MTNLDLKRLEHGSLSQRAAEALLNYILTNDLRPGASLPAVATLAESLGVSRPVVRESLNALRALGIIEIANGKKATIRDLDSGVLRVYFSRAMQIVDDSMRDVMDVRVGIEIRSAALAARHRSDEDIARLGDIMAQMREGHGGAAEFSLHDTALHLAISEASGNRLIFHIVESLQSALRNASYHGVLALGDRETLDGIVAEHARLVAAIVRGDEEEAAALMRDHLAAAMKRMAERMA
ncbi:FadR family transcriptional regulator [Siculibacillus lacustris]|uniref:FadR family transcriptional regulator n=1 Tax=Siculibacillus lacustris TaxID=1549641 RepID=A0A4Q9VNB9_9HYPH|nr:FadR/GntR family transcriptional regulator [Siculibacillus lacustris]TBW36613.1 FadR family transcriptional regulator [Siculibacillus lacustris]